MPDATDATRPGVVRQMLFAPSVVTPGALVLRSCGSAGAG